MSHMELVCKRILDAARGMLEDVEMHVRPTTEFDNEQMFAFLSDLRRVANLLSLLCAFKMQRLEVKKTTESEP